MLISAAVYSEISGKVGIPFVDAGEIKLKNIDRPLRAWRWDGGEARVDLKAATRFAAPLPADKPSIAVLPFTVMANDPEQEFFADGLVEDTLTTLARLSGLSVIARNSSFTYKGKAVDVRQIARELGVRYVLEGSVRKAGGRIRIAVQLIDGATGEHIWADRYDRALDDMFALQDEIMLTLATEMQVKLTEGEQARLRYTTTTNVEAWKLWIQGLNLDRQTRTPETHMAIRRCWESALALDPGSAVLNALLGDIHFSDARHGWSGEDRESALQKAESYIAKALSIDPKTPDAHRAAAGVLLVRQRFDEAAEAARRAAKLGFNLPDVLGFAGFVLTCCGHAEEAIFHIRKALPLNGPNHQPWHFGVLGNALRLSGRGQEALAAFRAYHARSPGFGLADIVMVEEQAGDLDGARKTAAELAVFRPTFTVATWLRTQVRVDKDQMAADLQSLRRAGVREN